MLKKKLSYVFWPPIKKQNLPAVFYDNEEKEWERLGNEGWMLEMDEGDGLTWTWSSWSI